MAISTNIATKVRSNSQASVIKQWGTLGKSPAWERRSRFPQRYLDQLWDREQVPSCLWLQLPRAHNDGVRQVTSRALFSWDLYFNQRSVGIKMEPGLLRISDVSLGLTQMSMNVPKFLRVFILEDQLLRYSSEETTIEASSLFPSADHLTSRFRGQRSLTSSTKAEGQQLYLTTGQAQPRSRPGHRALHFLLPTRL